MIAGFELPDAGHVELGGEDVTRLPPFERDVNTVFQDYALFPHMTVQRERRVRAAREAGARSASGARRRAEALAMVRLDGLRRPQARRSSPAASGSASRSRARSSTGRRCCCSTSRSARST